MISLEGKEGSMSIFRTKTTTDSGIKNFFAKTYMFFSLNIVISGAISYFIAQNFNIFHKMYPVGILTNLAFLVGWSLLLHVLKLQILKGCRVVNIMPLMLFFLTLEGFLFAPFILIFKAQSIIAMAGLSAFLIFTVGILGIYTSVDLSEYATIAVTGLVLVGFTEIICSVLGMPINLKLTSFLVICSILILTASDSQNLKNLYYQNHNIPNTNLALLGSITLFINFVILLVRLLQIFGEKKED